MAIFSVALALVAARLASAQGVPRLMPCRSLFAPAVPHNSGQRPYTRWFLDKRVAEMRVRGLHVAAQLA